MSVSTLLVFPQCCSVGTVVVKVSINIVHHGQRNTSTSIYYASVLLGVLLLLSEVVVVAQRATGSIHWIMCCSWQDNRWMLSHLGFNPTALNDWSEGHVLRHVVWKSVSSVEGMWNHSYLSRHYIASSWCLNVYHFECLPALLHFTVIRPKLSGACPWTCLTKACTWPIVWLTPKTLNDIILYI